MIAFGTAGFSYRDWRGVFYPPGLPEREWLAFYAREFDALELNVTFYRLPAARTAAAWVERTPDGFCFAVKAHRGLTHERGSQHIAAFRAAVRPLAEAGRLACVLAQFPPSFRPGADNYDYLDALREGLGDWPAVVEFRHAAWVAGEALAETTARLRALRLGLAAVDEPRLAGLVPPVAAVTGPVAYVRFHGRNAQQWHTRAAGWQRYDYDYSEDELRAWAPRIRALAAEAGRVLVIFNNTPRAQAVADARALRRILNAIE